MLGRVSIRFDLGQGKQVCITATELCVSTFEPCSAVRVTRAKSVETAWNVQHDRVVVRAN